MAILGTKFFRNLCLVRQNSEQLRTKIIKMNWFLKKNIDIELTVSIWCMTMNRRRLQHMQIPIQFLYQILIFIFWRAFFQLVFSLLFFFLFCRKHLFFQEKVFFWFQLSFQYSLYCSLSFYWCCLTWKIGRFIIKWN